MVIVHAFFVFPVVGKSGVNLYSILKHQYFQWLDIYAGAGTNAAIPQASTITLEACTPWSQPKKKIVRERDLQVKPAHGVPSDIFANAHQLLLK